MAIACLSCQLYAQTEDVNSFLEIIDVASGKQTLIQSFPYRVEAPNWTSDNYLIYNSKGKLYRISATPGSEPEEIPTGYANRCNNDHVLSSDGTQLAISHATREDHQSRIYTLPIGGGNPQLITPMAPSYLHGWSPDGKYLSYCAQRNGDYDIYVIPAIGGEEMQLTSSKGLDDGPEYSPCGQFIWFNSVRSGSMQVWRMDADGKNQQQMTFDSQYNAWFPHISPDGKQIVYLTYNSSDVKPGDHPANKQVAIWIMPENGEKPRQLIQLFGGQGTLNVNSWNPTSEKIAYVRYELNAD